jgi:tetratricopeptide (TPR) repeat protein
VGWGKKELAAGMSDQLEQARRLVETFANYDDNGQYAEIIALKDEALQLATALAQNTEKWFPQRYTQDDRSVTIALHEGLGVAYERMGMFVESVDLHKQRLDEAQRLRDDKGTAYAFKWLGNAHRLLMQHDQALGVHQRRLDLLESKPLLFNTSEMADAIKDVAQCYLHLGRSADSLKMHKKQLKRAEREGNVDRQILALTDLASAQSQSPSPDENAYDSLNKAVALVEMSERAGTSIRKAYHTYYRLGVVCSHMLQTTHFFLYTTHKKAGILPSEQNGYLQPAESGGKKDQVFEALHAFRRAIELHNDDKCAQATASFKQDALLLSARLLYMQGNEDEAVTALEESLEITVSMARALCAGCQQTRGQVSMLESTCGKCGVARYCNKEHQRMSWAPQMGEVKVTGVTQFLSHRFLCSALKSFKRIAKGKQQSEECRKEMLGLLQTMSHWKPPDVRGTQAILAKKQLVAGVVVEISSLKSSPELNGRQGKLIRYMGTMAEFLDFKNENDSSAEKWKVELEPLNSDPTTTTTTSKTIVTRASNLTYVSGPPDTEDETWWTSPQEDEEAAKLIIQMRLADGGGGGGGGEGKGGGGGAEASLEDGASTSGAREPGEFKEGDVVKLHSLQTDAFNGIFGTLTQFNLDMERWCVQLEKTPGKIIKVRATNLTFIRELKPKPLPGNNEIHITLTKMFDLHERQDWKGLLDMEGESLLTARALVLPTSGRQGRAEAVYCWLGIANERLAQKEQLRGTDIREYHHTNKALALYQQQLACTQEFGGTAAMRLCEARARGNLGNAYVLKGEYARAFEMHEHALSMFKQLGNRACSAVSCQTLAQLCVTPEVAQPERRQEFMSGFLQ